MIRKFSCSSYFSSVGEGCTRGKYYISQSYISKSSNVQSIFFFNLSVLDSFQTTERIAQAIRWLQVFDNDYLCSAFANLFILVLQNSGQNNQL
jgi:hypothetical protein